MFRHRTHRCGDRRPYRARCAHAGGQLHGAHLPDQRCLPRCGAGGDGVWAPQRRFRHRHRRLWPDPADNRANTAGVKEYYAAIAAHSEPDGYVNFASGDDQPRVVENYGSNYPRLLETKRRYDPDNLFHLNQNIQP